MSNQFTCPSCGKGYTVNANLAGKRVRCKCGTVSRLPDLVDASEVEDVDASLAFADEPAAPVVKTPTQPPRSNRTIAQPTRPALRPPPMPVAASEPLDFADELPPPSVVQASPAVQAPVFMPPTARTVRPIAALGGSTLPSKSQPTGRVKTWLGGTFGTLFVLIIIGLKIFRLVNIATSASSDNSTHRNSYSSRSPVVAARTAPPVPPLQAMTVSNVRPENTTTRGFYTVRSVTLTNGVNSDTHLNILCPRNASAQRPAPCVFITCAGTPLLIGTTISADDPDELREVEPYLKAGFAVCQYSESGAVDESDRRNEARLLAGYLEFRCTHGGVADGMAAMTYVAQQCREIDSKQFFAAGHSSAANAALLLAIRDPRIHGVAAYAPQTDLRSYWGSDKINVLSQVFPGFEDFLRDTSPTEAGRPNVPTLLFVADDDDVVSPANVRAYAATLPQSRSVSVPSGGHYDAMINRGISTGIEFFKNTCHAHPVLQ